MARYNGDPEFDHGRPQTLGLLVVNLGTPDDPTPAAVKRYLKQFLWDPRVVEQPRWLWWLILNLVILNIRPKRSAAAYQEIWTDDGSPLLLFSRELSHAIANQVAENTGVEVAVELAMSYGNPSIEDAIGRLRQRNARRLVVLPLYPQYSATTTGTVFDAVTDALSRLRWVPEFRFINQYHDAPGLIDALADSVRKHWDEHGQGEKLLYSFHGIPQRYFRAGDPYHCQCQKTARLVSEKLGLREDQYFVAFQSRVGREPWLMPYTDFTLEDWGKAGGGKIDVICPGFAADCLETLEEIALQNRELYQEAGGEDLRYVPCLNASDAHVAVLSKVVSDAVSGWPEAINAVNEHREATAERASTLDDASRA